MAQEGYTDAVPNIKATGEEVLATGQFYADLGESLVQQRAEIATSQIIDLIDKNARALTLGSTRDLDSSKNSGNIKWRVECIANDPAHVRELEGILRMLHSQLDELDLKLELGKAQLKERTYAVRDKVGKIVDHVYPTVEENFYGLAASGELYADDAIDFALTLSVDELQSLQAARTVESMGEGMEAFDIRDVDPQLLLDTFVSARNADNWARSGEQFEGAVVFHLNTFKTDFLNGNVVPYGEHGEEIAQRLAKTLQRLAKTLKKSEAVFFEAENNISQEEKAHLVRERDAEYGDSPAMLALYEGFVSIAQALALLSAQKIPNYEHLSDDVLLQDIVDAGLVQQLARVLPAPGIMAPKVIQGTRYNNMVIYEEGHLELNRDFVQQMHREKINDREHAIYRDRSSKERVLYNGCPVALRKPGEVNSDLNDLTEFFMEAFATTDNPAKKV